MKLERGDLADVFDGRKHGICYVEFVEISKMLTTQDWFPFGMIAWDTLLHSVAFWQLTFHTDYDNEGISLN